MENLKVQRGIVAYTGAMPTDAKASVRKRVRWVPFLLAAPAAVTLLIFLVLPTLQMMTYSVAGSVEGGVYRQGWTLSNYQRLVAVDLYASVLWRTIWLAVVTSIICAVLAYPAALIIARGPAWFARIVTMVLVTPLLVNVVIRSYGWSAILSRQGALNWLLDSFNLISAPVFILYTEAAVIIASVHVFLAFMVLPLAAALTRIDPALEQAAAVMGARPFTIFRRVTLPLSMPGLAIGGSLVFSLTAAAYVTPQILGGNFVPLLGTLIEQQILTLHDWPFGAAIATVLIAMVLGVNLIFLRFTARRFTNWTESGQ
jgi:putative spermidine/putrescine transport system permease protein